MARSRSVLNNFNTTVMGGLNCQDLCYSLRGPFLRHSSPNRENYKPLSLLKSEWMSVPHAKDTTLKAIIKVRAENRDYFAAPNPNE